MKSDIQQQQAVIEDKNCGNFERIFPLDSDKISAQI